MAASCWDLGALGPLPGKWELISIQQKARPWGGGAPVGAWVGLSHPGFCVAGVAPGFVLYDAVFTL